MGTRTVCAASAPCATGSDFFTYFKNSLLKKIQNAQKSFDKADGEVCDKLASFIAAVDAQDGKKLTTEQADLLRSQAEAIGDAHGCHA